MKRQLLWSNFSPRNDHTCGRLFRKLCSLSQIEYETFYNFRFAFFFQIISQQIKKQFKLFCEYAIIFPI